MFFFAETLKCFDLIFFAIPVSAETPAHIIKGEFAMGGQYHFQMETQIAICHPREDGLDVYSATQWIDLVQASIASALKIPNNE
jgi:xanthine dehydrogenase molybdopterin-binding subunit B